MKNIRTSISDCVNRAKYRELPAKTSNVIGISDYVSDNVHKALKDKVGLSMIFLIESGYEIRNVIENELEKEHEKY
jgi:hypothetical protein